MPIFFLFITILYLNRRQLFQKQCQPFYTPDIARRNANSSTR